MAASLVPSVAALLDAAKGAPGAPGPAAAGGSVAAEAPATGSDPATLVPSVAALLDSARAPVQAPGGGSPQSVTQTPYSTWDAIKQGADDMWLGGAQLLAHALPANVVNDINAGTAWLDRQPYIGAAAKAVGAVPETPAHLDRRIAQENADYEAGRAAAGHTGFDWPRAAGKFLVTAPVALTTGGASVGLLGAAAEGAGSGALTSALAPVENAGSSYGVQKAQQVGGGALVGAALPLVGGAVSRAVKPVISDAARSLAASGVSLTPGQLLGGAWKTAEDRLTSIPLLGDLVGNAQRASVHDFNRAVLNDVVAPLGGTVDSVGHEGVADVSRQLSDAYGRVLPHIQFRPDAELVSQIRGIAAKAQELPTAQFSRFSNILKAQLKKLPGDGSADPEAVKGVMSELGRVARGYRGDASFDNRALGRLLEDVNGSLRQSLARTNPAYAPQLNAIDRAYSNYALVRDAAGRTGSRGGVFTPAQLRAAVRAADRSVGKGNFARGVAKMQGIARDAADVIGQNYPNSGTPGRLLMDGGLLGILGGRAPEILSAVAAHPAGAVLGGLAMLPYAPIARRAVSGLLTDRPAFAAPLAQAIESASRRAAPLLAPVLGGALPNTAQ